MKKVAIPLSLFALLLVMTGVASASPPEADSFTMTGYTTWYDWDSLPSGQTRFYLTAQGGAETAPDNTYCAWLATQLLPPLEVGTCTELCAASTGQEACGIDGDGFLQGSFTFEEWGIVDIDTGLGTNRGLLTITTDDGEVLIRFGGKTDSVNVWGNFTVLQGTGNHANLRGQGKYTGDASLVFKVAYEGRFHTDPE